MTANLPKWLAYVLLSTATAVQAEVVEFRTFDLSLSKPIAEYSNPQVSFTSPTNLVANLNVDGFNFLEGLDLGNQPGSFTATLTNPATAISLETFDRDTRRAFNILSEILVPSVFSANYFNASGESVGSDTFSMDGLLGSFHGENSTQFSSVVISWQTGTGLFLQNEDPFCDGGPGCPPTVEVVAPLLLGISLFGFSNPIPEPETYALMVAGLGVLVFMSKFRPGKSAKA
ncbi:MAG TPA: PEP-CTERM sorting domain-containing protein [Methylophilaceae bacterium]|nr:PEP-CTERM sorting domain-containing protein [Methylophilaceae bacterium]